MSLSITVYSTAWCPDCIAAKAVLKSMNVDFEEINIDETPVAENTVIELNHGNRTIPTIVFSDGSVLSEPKITELKQKILSLS